MREKMSFQDYQNYLKVLLYFFDDLCRNNQISYTVIDGTLLGAVRQNDIIPWDGDVDVAMTWKEFFKLIEVFKSYTGRYYLSYLPDHIYKKGKYYGMIHARLIDKKCNNPMYCLDIFTIDFLGDDYNFALETLERYKYFYNKSVKSIAFHVPSVKRYKSLKENIRNIFIGVFYPIFLCVAKFNGRSFKRKYADFIKKRLMFDEDSKYYSIEPYLGRFGVRENNILKNGYTDMAFGSMKVMAVKNYEEYLTETYGDYMQLPPSEKRVPYPSEAELLNCKIIMDNELQELLKIVKGD